MMEGCSVCTCDEDEIPKPWLENKSKKPKKSEYGWITSSASSYGFEGQGHDDSLGRISVAEGEAPNMQLDGMYNDLQLRDQDVRQVDTGVAGIQNDPEEDSDDSGNVVITVIMGLSTNLYFASQMTGSFVTDPFSKESLHTPTCPHSQLRMVIMRFSTRWRPQRKSLRTLHM